MSKISETEKKGMRRLSHEEVQQAELEMLSAFDGFCKRHDIAYSLAGGTCLGAVRHKGFIPWDDDIDLMVSRPNFERLKGLGEELRGETGFRLWTVWDAPWAKTPFLRVENPRVVLERDYLERSDFLWLDVFSVEGLPAGNIIGLYGQAMLAKRIIVLSTAKADRGKTRLKTLLKPFLVSAVKRLHLGERSISRLDFLARKVPYGSTPYVGVVAGGVGGTGERISLEGYEKKILMPFEGREFSCMSNWDEYLTGLYGDYMQLPPVEKRKTHDFTAYMIGGESA